jgi:hypothetical protein
MQRDGMSNGASRPLRRDHEHIPKGIKTPLEGKKTRRGHAVVVRDKYPEFTER